MIKVRFFSWKIVIAGWAYSREFTVYYKKKRSIFCQKCHFATLGIPQINPHLFSEPMIVPNVLDRVGPNDDLFETEAMQILDDLLSHMDDADYEGQAVTILERIIHEFHMKDLIHRVVREYNKVKLLRDKIKKAQKRFFQCIKS